MRFSASSAPHNAPTKFFGEEGDSFSFTFSAPVPGLDKKMKLQDLAEQLKKLKATSAYKAYEKDVQDYQRKEANFHWGEDMDAENAAYEALIGKHTVVIQKEARLNAEADKLE